MATTKWTPREIERNSDCWQVEGDDLVCQLYYLDEETHRRIPIQPEKARKHATMIAAAPDLYEALEQVLYMPGSIIDPDAREQARIALAKARGGQ
jgi:hypothetical protein